MESLKYEVENSNAMAVFYHAVRRGARRGTGAPAANWGDESGCATCRFCTWGFSLFELAPLERWRPAGSACSAAEGFFRCTSKAVAAWSMANMALLPKQLGQSYCASKVDKNSVDMLTTTA